jgi:hypothetical protein
MERRKYETEEEKQAKLPGIRDYSRQAYLKKREEQKLEELKDAIEDEKALFGVPTFLLCLAHTAHQNADLDFDPVAQTVGIL